MLAAILGAGAIAADSRPAPSSEPHYTAEVRDLDIAFYQARVERDPEGAIDRARLGALYLQRARETGSLEDLDRAESVARASFAVRARKNGEALHVLAAALMGQHRYQEALAEVHILLEHDSASIAWRALRGEIEMELGDYRAAEATFNTLAGWSHRLTVAPRLARWEELRGNVDGARRLLDRARDQALRQVNMPVEQVAWFHYRVGDLAFRYGRTGDAERAWQAGLRLSPRDHRLLAGMARLESSRKDWARAVRYGEAALAQSMDPAILGLLADAHEAAGDNAQAADYARAMELMVMHQPGAWHRAWALYLLQHDRRVEEVLQNLETDLATRRDVYGLGLYALALHKTGRTCQARAAMSEALALGTRDPLITGHAALTGSTPCPTS